MGLQIKTAVTAKKKEGEGELQASRRLNLYNPPKRICAIKNVSLPNAGFLKIRQVTCG